MKKIFILALFIISFGIAKADSGGYIINNYNTYINLNADASMDVSEKIDINFSEKRHGIYRQIPIVDANGENISISNLNAIDDPVSSNDIEAGYYTLRIGSANQTIIGQHIYNISYKINNAIKEGKGFKYIKFNVFGNKRNTTINKMSFIINIPTHYKFSSGEIFLFYGKDKDKLTGDSYIYQSGSQIIGYINKALEPNTSVTVGLKFPIDYFQLSSNYDKYSDKNSNSQKYFHELIIQKISKISVLIATNVLDPNLKTKINTQDELKSLFDSFNKMVHLNELSTNK